MKIDTRWSIGDKVWGVECTQLDRDVPCEACHGEGGANIPGTGVYVECGECGGRGETLKRIQRYSAVEEVIKRIVVECDEYHQSPKIAYWFRRHTYTLRFAAILENEQDAWAEAKRLADSDKDGELRPNPSEGAKPKEPKP